MAEPLTIDTSIPDWDRPLAERQLAVLTELAEAGRAMALAIAGEVRGEEGRPPPTEEEKRRRGLAFDRVLRAVRLTYMLRDRLVKELKAGQPSAIAERQALVQRVVGRIADVERPMARPTIARLTAERLERDFAGDILSRPVSELVAMICKTIPLKVDWPTVAQEHWAKEEIESGEVGWPLAARTPPTINDGEPESRNGRPGQGLSP